MFIQREMLKGISSFVILAMLAVMLPHSIARADDSPFDDETVSAAVYGTADDPYVITTASQLYEIRHDASQHFVLGADINLDVPEYNAGEGWEPIPWFNGTLDGNGFEITGLYINRPVDENVGLFRILSDQAVVSNVKLVNVEVTGNYAVGGLVGWNRGSIHHSSVSGKVTGADAEYESDSIGGMAGMNQGDISHSHASGEVTGYYLVGGLAGSNEGSMQDSFASGNVNGVDHVGGLVGWNFSGTTIINSHASGKVTGYDEVGGLTGRNSGTLSHSYASGEVDGNRKVGGLVGVNVQEVSNSYANGKVSGQHEVGGLVGEHYRGQISNSYASGAVTGNSQTGGLVGSKAVEAGDVTNSYWDTQASGQEQSAGGEGKTTEELRKKDTFADNWDLLNVWSIGEVGTYPLLRWALNMIAPPPWNGEGTGTESNPFLIASAEQFNDVRNYLDAHFEIAGDIDLSLAYGAGEGWEPIGTTSHPFIGTIDGNGYKITGLYINRSGQNEVGLFGVTGNGAEISNIRLANVDVAGHAYVGILVGANAGDIHNVYVSGEVTGSSFVGGLVGAHAGNIDQSYASGKVDGVHFIGGLVGTNGGTIGNSYASGEVIVANAFAGGLVGSNDGGTIRDSYASGKVTGDHFVGGLAGDNAEGTVTASYWDKDSTNQTTSAGSSEEHGKSAVEMKKRATFAGWDWDHIWAIDEGESHPYLQSDYEGPGFPWTGSGTEEDPYILKTAAHLNQVRDHPDAHYELGADINLDIVPYNTGEGWEPIGTATAPFNGKLNGMGYKITGLYMDRSTDDVGLFGSTSVASQISNVKLEDVSVTVAATDPALVRVGGLAGHNDGTISYSSVSGKVEGGSNAGILVGYNDGNISYTSASGEITGGDFLGGLAGVNEGTITQSFASGKVMGIDALGGLVGINAGRINNSYATGDVLPAQSYSGGLAGVNQGGTIRNSYASGKVVFISGYGGGLVSENNSGNVHNSYWDKETTLQTSSAGSIPLFGKSTTEMKQQATFAGWDFDRIWGIEEGEQYPYLKWVGNANLSDLTLSEGTLSPVFAGETIHYKASVKSSVNSVNLTATAASGGASLKVNGTSASSGVATVVPLLAGRNTIDVAVTAYDGIKAKQYTIELTRQSEDSSSSDQPDTEMIDVPVETGDIGSATTVMQTTITRMTERSGRVRDVITMTSDRARETARRIAEAGQTTARIMIPDPEDKVSQVDVRILKEAIREFVDHNVNLEIYSENIRLRISQRSIDAMDDDLFFRIIPLKEESQRQDVENRARSEQAVRAAANQDKVKVVSRPMTIETNMPHQPVTLVLPLRDVQLPANAAERAKWLQELMIFIEHSDGEKRLVKGKIVEYKDDGLGIEFEVNKFSTFTILHLEGIAESYHEAYIQGYEDGSFQPDRTVTRAEIAVMIARNLGFKGSKGATESLFADVPGAHWAVEAIAFVKQQGFMIGDGAGTFKPNAAITRAEMAAIAARYKPFAFATEEERITAFTDIAGHWAASAIAANKHTGILNGYEDGSFRPNAYVTRAEAVAIMNRMFDRGPLYEVSPPTFIDVRETHWAFHEVEEAARDHFFTTGWKDGEYKVR